MFPTWSDWDILYTRKGLIKKRVKSLLRVLVYFSAIAGFVSLRRHGKGPADVKAMLRKFLRYAILKASGVLQRTGEKIPIT